MGHKFPVHKFTKLSSLPIASNESFTFDYNNKRGVEMEFKPRRKYA
jgi:hypothetical protein